MICHFNMYNNCFCHCFISTGGFFKTPITVSLDTLHSLALMHDQKQLVITPTAHALLY